MLLLLNVHDDENPDENDLENDLDNEGDRYDLQVGQLGAALLYRLALNRCANMTPF